MSRQTIGQAADITWHQLAISDRQAVTDLFRDARPSHLLHLAWVTTGAYYTSAANLHWLEDSLALVRAFTATALGITASIHGEASRDALALDVDLRSPDLSAAGKAVGAFRKDPTLPLAGSAHLVAHAQRQEVFGATLAAFLRQGVRP